MEPMSPNENTKGKGQTEIQDFPLKRKTCCKVRHILSVLNMGIPLDKYFKDLLR